MALGSGTFLPPFSPITNSGSPAIKAKNSLQKKMSSTSSSGKGLPGLRGAWFPVERHPPRQGLVQKCPAHAEQANVYPTFIEIITEFANCVMVRSTSGLPRMILHHGRSSHRSTKRFNMCRIVLLLMCQTSTAPSEPVPVHEPSLGHRRI